MTLYASDVMVKEVITVTESTPLKDVARMFIEKKITGAPVVNVEGELVGVISETDIIRKTTSIGAWSPSTVGGDGYRRADHDQAGGNRLPRRNAAARLRDDVQPPHSSSGRG
jgi:predicted transcriptional regulator